MINWKKGGDMKFKLSFGDSGLDRQVCDAKRTNKSLLARSSQLESKLNYLKEQIEQKKALTLELTALNVNNEKIAGQIQSMEQSIGDFIKEIM